MSEISTFAPTAANLWAVVQSYEIDPALLFEEENIDINFPIDANARISYHKFDRVRARAAEVSGDEAIGLRTGEFMHPSHLGALGYAWLASRTLRIALQRWQRFIRIVNRGARLGMNEHKGMMEIEMAIDLPSANKVVRDDSAAAALTKMMRYNYGPHLNPSFISMKRPTPVDTTPWDSYFGCEIEFDAKRNEIHIPLDIVDILLPSANPHLAKLNEELVIQYLEHLDREDFTGRVHAEIVQQLPCGHLDQSMVAEALHMTPRTLRRRLKSRSITFKSLLNEARREMADQLIAETNLTVTEISFMLGFSEASSFSRAFRNWNGCSPSAARELSQ